ncbi:energy coupling factor transporter S component ThiW [Turicibacter sp. H121]|uniref:energy coupling factor transporter S component ThiW n=1 Tax=Turicibacter sp. H121 TaxID=1712675 RepID=UPI0009EB7C31
MGSGLEFPRSIVGAFFSRIFIKQIELAVSGEIIGTWIIGTLLTYPLAALVIGKEVAVLVYLVLFQLVWEK